MGHTARQVLIISKKMFFRILRVSVFLCHAFLYAVTDFDDADFTCPINVDGEMFGFIPTNICVWSGLQ